MKIVHKIKRRIIKYKVKILGQHFPKLIHSKARGRYTVTHISAFSWDGNAGDTLLPVVLRDLFNQTIGVRKWHGVHVHKSVNDESIDAFNKDSFVVIGGGGLFLADTNPNNLSGWQWSCSVDALKKIRKPIIAFALGYNRFRGQEDFKPIFTKHLNAFVEQAAFVGIRNHGSIEKLKMYLRTEELREKLVFQPCMTTLISKIYPSLCDYNKKEDFVAFNCAFDRSDLRQTDESFLKAIARVALEMSKITKIKYYSHMEVDNRILPYFDRMGVCYELVELKSVRRIIKCYAKPRLVIGMRGHAQMIPFGCGTPILSIISHDKMQWFLDDIHHPEWGADVRDADFEQTLLSKALNQYHDYERCMAEIEEEKKCLYRITLENMRNISINV